MHFYKLYIKPFARFRRQHTVRFLFKNLSMSTRCRFLLLLEMGTLILQWNMPVFFTSIDWAFNLPSSARRPSLPSIPESDNCDWKVNNYKQTNIDLDKRRCYVRDFSTQVSSKWAILIWKFYFLRTVTNLCTCNKLDFDYLDTKEAPYKIMLLL